MDSDAAYFFLILALQVVFTVALVALIARRFPKRAPLYRWIAPAAVPLLSFLFILSLAVRPDVEGPPLGLIAISHLVLWLLGVLLASLVILLFRR